MFQVASDGMRSEETREVIEQKAEKKRTAK